MINRHRERHRLQRIGWLRAAVLGANDGIVSTASLLVGVAAADASHGSLLAAGVAGAVAGAMSMAAGEYVSVQLAGRQRASRARARAQRARERRRRRAPRAHGHLHGPRPEGRARASKWLTRSRRTTRSARTRATSSGITDLSIARPLQAAGASAASFACGALLPLLVAALVPVATRARGGAGRRRSSSWRRSAPSPRARAAPPSASPPPA